MPGAGSVLSNLFYTYLLLYQHFSFFINKFKINFHNCRAIPIFTLFFKISLTILFCLFDFLKLLYCCSIRVVWNFSPPLSPTPAKPTSLPCFHPPPWFCPCVLYSSSWKSFFPLSPPHSPLAIVRMFLTSMSLVIFCLVFFVVVDYVPVKGEIIWYLSLTAWLISLSIMLSSSICAVTKDGSSFLSAA